MGPDTRIAILFALGVSVSSLKLRLEKNCNAGDPSGTNHSRVYADNFFGCARACDVNTNCYFVSFHGTECVMYGDELPCDMGVGPTRNVYKVDPRCEPGWHRYGGACYLVDLNGKNGVMGLWGCAPYYIQHTANPVSINNAAEGVFLAQLLLSMNASYTSVWVGGTYNYGPFDTWYGSNEPLVFQNWDDGEPDNLDIEVCVAMNLSNGKWKTENCGLVKISVCEMPL